MGPLGGWASLGGMGSRGGGRPFGGRGSLGGGRPLGGMGPLGSRGSQIAVPGVPELFHLEPSIHGLGLFGPLGRLVIQAEDQGLDLEGSEEPGQVQLRHQPPVRQG